MFEKFALITLRKLKIQKMKTICSTARNKLKVAWVSSQRHRNVDTLRSIIPGCEDADVETLFLKTMEHIIKLELQVHILGNLTIFVVSDIVGFFSWKFAVLF
ncbi:hypothetical protein I3842_07G188800 [Carya illinoinensis]|uniref:Uncharacterized protein n=1 Tax=Carya illinoinensis TaxID=32201 RepID=A0A922EKY1_CARIL|nr:hypothetical protein I3842_07G188800 [Carya illinoinensis]